METGSASVALRSATAAAVAVVLTAGGLWAVLAGRSRLADGGPGQRPGRCRPTSSFSGAAGVGAVLLAWLGLGVTLSALAAAPGAVGRLPRRRPSASPRPRSGG